MVGRLGHCFEVWNRTVSRIYARKIPVPHCPVCTRLNTPLPMLDPHIQTGPTTITFVGPVWKGSYNSGPGLVPGTHTCNVPPKPQGPHGRCMDSLVRYWCARRHRSRWDTWRKPRAINPTRRPLTTTDDPDLLMAHTDDPDDFKNKKYPKAQEGLLIKVGRSPYSLVSITLSLKFKFKIKAFRKFLDPSYFLTAYIIYCCDL